MSAIDFGVDHKFYPTGRTPEELAVGFLVADTNSPSDFIKLKNVPTPVVTETLSPVASLDAHRKDAAEAAIKSFLSVHYDIDLEKSAEVKAVKVVRERLNNLDADTVQTMLNTTEAIKFLKRIAEQYAARSKLKSWKKFFFNLNPSLVVSTQTFYDSEVDVKASRSVEEGVDVTAPVATAASHGATDVGDITISQRHEQTSSASQAGHTVKPLVFAAKYQQVRYKLIDEKLVKSYLMEDKPVPVGFFGGDDDEGEDSIKDVEDIVALIHEGDIEVGVEED